MTESENDQLPAKTDDFERTPVVVRLSATADAMEEFNRLLWQLAKGVFIIAAILLALFLVFSMYLLANLGWAILP